jgi:hypothetical protein
MMLRDWRRFSLVAGTIVAFLIVSHWYWQTNPLDRVPSHAEDSIPKVTPVDVDPPKQDLPTPDSNPRPSTPTALPEQPADIPTSPSSSSSDVAVPPDSSHHVLYSLSSPDKRFFRVKFGQYSAINPNIIPRPGIEDEYIIVAQKNQTFDLSPFFYEVACVAKFTASGDLDCIHLPHTLPIAATYGAACPEGIKFMHYNVGPHDARVFWGPEKPFAIWQSNSRHTCISQYMQDFRLLFDWGPNDWDPADFFTATEILRPVYDSPIEKNWFVFWDKDNQLYAHYDIFPNRSFAKVALDGTVGWDLAPQVADSDKACLAKSLPAFELTEPDTDSIHQATNSLSVTMCNRADPDCKPTDSNTFLFTVFHHKLYINSHSYYEPYVMMFQNTAPFAIQSISSKPLWINGRRMQEPHAEMFFVVAMSWKGANQTYHGYLDDEMFLSIGIEDQNTAGIDVLASELLYGMRDC